MAAARICNASKADLLNCLQELHAYGQMQHALTDQGILRNLPPYRLQKGREREQQQRHARELLWAAGHSGWLQLTHTCVVDTQPLWHGPAAAGSSRHRRHMGQWDAAKKPTMGTTGAPGAVGSEL